MCSRNIIKIAFSNARRSALLNNNELLWQPKLKWRQVGVRREFHQTRCLAAKIYIDKENMYAHEVLEHSLKPYQLFRLTNEHEIDKPLEATLPAEVLEQEIRAENLTADEIYTNFCALARYCASTNTHLSEQRFKNFTQRVCDVCHKFSDEQLVQTLRHIALLPTEASVKALNFVELWNCLDVECCRRIENWETNQLLLVCDAWYTLHLARICEFVWEALRKMGRKIKRMRPEQLVHTMFLCNVMRRQVFDMFDFEENLARCVNEMTLQELGVMSMGFFKTQTPIRNPVLLEHLYRRLTAELDTVGDITLVAILKVLRYSTKLPQAKLMMELLEALCAQIPRISLLSCLHVALLGSDLQCCHDGILELVLQRFSGEIAQTRLKDIERICFALGVFNYRSPQGVDEQLCAKILVTLRTRIDEILKYPRCFPTCLHYLTLRGYHDAEMISSVLETSFIRHAYGSNTAMGREMFNLDSFVKINLKDSNYAGNQLLDKYRRSMGKMLTHYIPERNSKYKLNTTDRVLLEIKETADRIFRPCTFKHILPHFERPDIVVCFDNKQRKALPLAEECPEDYSGTILTRQELLGSAAAPHIDTVAIVVAGWNNVVRQKDRHTGLFDMKLKQLRLLGHKYAVIYWHEWYELETQTDRQHFLKRKLLNVIKL